MSLRPTDEDLAVRIETLVKYVDEHGEAMEALVRERQGRNPGFAFLCGAAADDQGRAYYLHLRNASTLSSTTKRQREHSAQDADDYEGQRQRHMQPRSNDGRTEARPSESWRDGDNRRGGGGGGYDGRTEARPSESWRDGDERRGSGCAREWGDCSSSSMATGGGSAASQRPSTNASHDAETERQLDLYVEAKRRRDYATSDAIRAQLMARGVRPDDARPWAPSAARAHAPAGRADGTHDAETERQLDLFVEAKRRRDYATSDAIRAQLMARGIHAERARPAGGGRMEPSGGRVGGAAPLPGAAAGASAMAASTHDAETERQLGLWVDAKRRKDFVTADAIRSQLEAKGVRPEQARPRGEMRGESGGGGAEGGGARGSERTGLFAQLKISRAAAEVASLLQRIGELRQNKEWCLAISALGRTRQCERALELLHEFEAQGLPPDLFVYNAAISACEKGQQWQKALDLLSHVEARGMQPTVVTYSAAISACEKGAQWQKALELLSQMKARGIEREVITYNAAISACEKGAQWEKALELLSQMEAEGLQLNVVTYSAAISACEKGAQWRRALDLLAQMEAHRVQPNVITYNALISACEKGAQWEKALELLERMRRLHLQPNVITYSAAVSACEKGQQWEQALDLLTQMKADGVQPEVITYNAAISACEKGAQWQKALELLERMEADGLQLNVVTYSAAISACEKGAQWQRALDLLSQMEARRVTPNTITFSALISACVKGDQWERGLALLSQMQRHDLKPDVHCYSAAISACEKGRQWRRALDLLSQMEADGVPPNGVSYTAAMQALVAASQLDAAFGLLQRLHDGPLAGQSYQCHLVLLDACRRAGDARMSQVQDDINRLGLTTIATVCKFVIDGREMQHVNGTESNEVADRFYQRVCRQTLYRPKGEVVAFALAHRGVSEADQVNSLRYHAEKKALASLVHEDAPELTMRVNMKVCEDCHSFLTHAARLLGRRIRVLELNRQHEFQPAGAGAGDGDGDGDGASAGGSECSPCAR